MPSELVIAVYRAKPGKEEDLAKLIEGHVPLLRERGLATDREAIVMRSPKDGTFLEVFEWQESNSADAAHTDEAVGPLWGQMGEIADFLTLADVPEATKHFPHFNPV